METTYFIISIIGAVVFIIIALYAVKATREFTDLKKEVKEEFEDLKKEGFAEFRKPVQGLQVKIEQIEATLQELQEGLKPVVIATVHEELKRLKEEGPNEG